MGDVLEAVREDVREAMRRELEAVREDVRETMRRERCDCIHSTQPFGDRVIGCDFLDDPHYAAWLGRAEVPGAASSALILFLVDYHQNMHITHRFAGGGSGGSEAVAETYFARVCRHLHTLCREKLEKGQLDHVGLVLFNTPEAPNQPLKGCTIEIPLKKLSAETIDHLADLASGKSVPHGQVADGGKSRLDNGLRTCKQLFTPKNRTYPPYIYPRCIHILTCNDSVDEALRTTPSEPAHTRQALLLECEERFLKDPSMLRTWVFEEIRSCPDAERARILFDLSHELPALHSYLQERASGGSVSAEERLGRELLDTCKRTCRTKDEQRVLHTVQGIVTGFGDRQGPGIGINVWPLRDADSLVDGGPIPPQFQLTSFSRELLTYCNGGPRGPKEMLWSFGVSGQRRILQQTDKKCVDSLAAAIEALHVRARTRQKSLVWSIEDWIEDYAYTSDDDDDDEEEQLVPGTRRTFLVGRLLDLSQEVYSKQLSHAFLKRESGLDYTWRTVVGGNGPACDVCARKTLQRLRMLARHIRVLTVSSTVVKQLRNWISYLTHVEKMSICGNLKDPDIAFVANGDESGGLQDEGELSLFFDSIGKLPRLQSLELQGLGGLASLPRSLSQLTGLERLCIEGCHPDLVSSLDMVSTHLKELCLRRCDVRCAPAGIHAFATLRALELETGWLRDLPDWLGQMTTLQELNLALESLTTLSPSIFAKLSNLTRLTICCRSLTEMRSSIFDNCALTSLTIKKCHALTEELRLDRQTTLKTLDISSCRGLSLVPPLHLECLRIHDCILIDGHLPLFIRQLTALRTLRLERVNSFNREKNYMEIASALPSMVLLENLHLEESKDKRVDKRGRRAIALALRAWPKPCLTVSSERFFTGVWKGMHLPAEASLWHDASYLRYFAKQQQKFVVFACALHPRLGEASNAACLNDQSLSMIADKLFGRRLFTLEDRFTASDQRKHILDLRHGAGS